MDFEINPKIANFKHQNKKDNFVYNNRMTYSSNRELNSKLIQEFLMKTS